jgi:hypothetical protein
MKSEPIRQQVLAPVTNQRPITDTGRRLDDSRDEPARERGSAWTFSVPVRRVLDVADRPWSKMPEAGHPEGDVLCASRVSTRAFNSFAVR